MQQVTRFKIVNISFDDKIGSRFTRNAFCYKDLRQFLKPLRDNQSRSNTDMRHRNAFAYRADVRITFLSGARDSRGTVLCRYRYTYFTIVLKYQITKLSLQNHATILKFTVKYASGKCEKHSSEEYSIQYTMRRSTKLKHLNKRIKSRELLRTVRWMLKGKQRDIL